MPNVLTLPVVDTLPLHCLTCDQRLDISPDAPFVQAVKDFAVAHGHGDRPRIELRPQVAPVR
jgi:hypothetical protein